MIHSSPLVIRFSCCFSHSLICSSVSQCSCRSLIYLLPARASSTRLFCCTSNCVRMISISDLTFSGVCERYDYFLYIVSRITCFFKFWISSVASIYFFCDISSWVRNVATSAFKEVILETYSCLSLTCSAIIAFKDRFSSIISISCSNITDLYTFASLVHRLTIVELLEKNIILIFATTQGQLKLLKLPSYIFIIILLLGEWMISTMIPRRTGGILNLEGPLVLLF